MESEIIKQHISTQLKCEHIEIDGDGHHFQALIVSDDFIDKSRVKQQQMVYACIQSLITSGELHAISLQTLTIAEWQKNG